ncbi:MAG: hypothetical protein WBW46_11175 [Candidatus Sulfotelmatobacter sp.]
MSSFGGVILSGAAFQAERKPAKSKGSSTRMRPSTGDPSPG